MTISLFVNFNKANAQNVANAVIDFLCDNCQSVIADKATYKALDNKKITATDDAYKNCDVCIALGGDGTIIHTAKKASLFEKPVLGINLGRIGYLSAIETDELSLLKNLINNNYVTEYRSMLDVEVVTNGEKVCYTAFNDAVITKGSLSRMLDISLTIDAHSIAYRSDGLIVSTPTGSTAYSLSAGGPIIDPKVDDILITPICPYTGFNRPFIIPSSTTITMNADISENKEAYLTVDGELALKLYKDNIVTVKKAEQKVLLISLNGENGLFSIDKSLKKGVV